MTGQALAWPLRALIGSVAGFALAGPASADAVADFYKGKTITLQVGFGAGGGYDITARIFARHFGKHVPGNPTVVVSNMPGSGSIRLANYIYNAAPKDGTMIGEFSAVVMLEPLFGNKNALYSGDKFNWLGNIHSDINSCGVWKGGGVGIKTFDDLRTAKKTIVFGSTSPESETGRFPTFMHTVFGAPVKVVNGYKGTRAINLAMQNGEVNATCGMYESSVRGSFMNDVRSGDLKIVFQAGLDRKVPLFTDAKSIGELIKGKGEEMGQIAELIFRPSEITRPVAAPPGTPKERVDALKAAFRATMKDPEMIAEGKKIEVDFLPMTGERVAELMSGFIKTPPAVVKKALDLSTSPK
ncbi:MAG: Bug family tripartite tricarboxylate transporter substrate binding protein [Hyphomicrobiaceae bacterium]